MSIQSLLPILFIILLFNLISGNTPFLISAFLTNPLLGLTMAFGLVAGISIHEAAHAFVAYRLGDPTAKLAGRLTLNPLAHLDPIGTFALLFLGFGWGKPTPFDPFNLRNIKRDSALISVAGAASNFILALLISIPYLIAFYTHNLSLTLNMVYIYLSPIIFFNIILGVFNLIPISPLDGFKVLAGILPRAWYEEFMATERFGIIILLLLIFTGAIGQILFPIVSVIFSTLIPGLPAQF